MYNKFILKLLKLNATEGRYIFVCTFMSLVYFWMKVSVNYEARAKGVKGAAWWGRNRMLRRCGLTSVWSEYKRWGRRLTWPSTGGRALGRELIEVLQQAVATLERASMDEAYLTRLVWPKSHFEDCKSVELFFYLAIEARLSSSVDFSTISHVS